MVEKADILNTLHSVVKPHVQQDVGISGIVVRPDGSGGFKVGFALEVPASEAAHMEPMRQQCEAAVRRLPGVTQVTAVLTAQRVAGAAPPPPAPARPAEYNSQGLPFVNHVIAVASGKGGVGKSTVTANLAVALAKQGLRVGLLDADIYGPSMPMMFGLSGQPEIADEKLVPPLAHGVKVMSIGLLVGEEQAVVWRGAMVTKALRQMLAGVRWGSKESPLDVLLVDMPPGTGDIHLTLAQAVPLSGAVIVSTPQDVAVLDAVRCLAMFRKVSVPILGMVENMSGFTDATGVVHDIFGKGGAEKAAKEHDAPYLGAVPIAPELRVASDTGTPLSASQPDHAASRAFSDMAARLAASLSLKQAA
ncbi:P-loop NTPase [bacterium]|nr:P-loop NTPase [bacterium]